MKLTILLVLFNLSMCYVAGTLHGKKGVVGGMDKKDHRKPEAPNERNIDDFSKSIRLFTAELYSAIALRVGETENIFFSPNSIAHTLGMVMTGAKGNTLSEIKDTMKINKMRNYSKYSINNMFKKIYNKLFNVTRGHTMEAVMANKMYLQQIYPVFQEYKDNLTDFYNAEVEWVDFGAENTPNVINNWVDDATGGLINNIINPDSITSMTRLVLVNALYFKASWENKMKPAGLEKFFTMEYSNNKYSRIPFIGQFNKIMRGYEEEDLIEVGIPYENDDAYLIIMMPENEKAMTKYSKRTKMINYLRNLPDSFNNTWHSQAINFKMPMFEVEMETDLKEILTDMGVKDLFAEGAADLSGIAEEELYCSMFTHKAKIKVDEQGTVAAAATGVVMTGRSARPTEIVIDKPFFFAIYRLGHLLFFGKIVNIA